jgi:hypothetical protein
LDLFGYAVEWRTVWTRLPKLHNNFEGLQFLLDELGWGVIEWAQQAASWSQQRHRFKNTAAIGIDAHNRAGPVP